MSLDTNLPDLGSPPDRIDPDLRKWLVRAREHIREIRGIAGDPSGAAGTGGGGSGSPSAGPPGPQGPTGPPGSPDPYVPDSTPPPTPSGVTVTAGLAAVYITTAQPLFTEGHGYARTLVYGAKYSGTGPLPTFANASLQHEFIGEVGSFPSDLGTQWHIWVKWLTVDNVASVVPFGGTNGVQVTTGKIGTADLGPLIVEAGNLASGAVTATKLAAGAVEFTKFAAGLEPVGVVATLPNPVGYTGPRTVVLTTDGKLYRLVSGAWTAAVPAADIAGTLADAQIAALAASKITGQLSDAQIASIAAAKLTGQITSTQITDGAISTPKLAAGAVTAAQIAANTITASQIAAGAITATELAAGSVVAAKIAAGAVVASTIAAGAVTTSKLAANAVTANEIAANAITTAKIAAGAVNADQIAAGAVRTTKLLIAPSAGGYVNPDPLLQDSQAWTFLPYYGTAPSLYPAFNGGPGLVNAWDKLDGRLAYIFGPKFPISSSRTYQVESSIYQWGASIPTFYLGVAFYDANDALLEGQFYPTGWPAGGTYHYYGRINQTSPVGATRYSHTFGASATAKIPATAVTAQVLILGSENDAGVRWSWGGAQVREIIPGELIVDGAITANKIAANAIAVGTAAIQNGAIVNAMIADATIDSAKIASLAASKITAGSINVGAFIQSSNYIAGVSGWRIEGNGFAELGAAAIRGQLTATQIAAWSISAGRAIIADGTINDAKIETLTASKITAGNIQAGGYIRSTSYTPGSDGWSINANGTAEFRNVLVRGDVEATTVNGASGTFGTVTAGLLRNAGNTTRIDLNATGSQDFLRAGNGAVRITADGDAYFTKSLATGTWTGSLALVESLPPTFEFTTPEKELLIDTGVNVPRGTIFERTLSCRIGQMLNTYTPGESSGQYIGNLQYESEVVLRAPFFANNVENAGQNPYGSGNQRAFIRFKAQLVDRDSKTAFALTSIAWTLDTVG